MHSLWGLFITELYLQPPGGVLFGWLVLLVFLKREGLLLCSLDVPSTCNPQGSGCRGVGLEVCARLVPGPFFCFVFEPRTPVAWVGLKLGE